MSQNRKSFSDAWEHLTVRHATGKPEPQAKPTTLPLRRIKRRPEVFQHRRIHQSFSDAHVRALESAARGRSSRTLDPVTVWWDGKAWVCIDGHHRLDAYQRLDRDMVAVPVEVFSGSPEAALAHAALGNTKAKLPMTQAECSDAAWRLVATTDLSKAQLADAAGVSEATIAIMRRAKGVLEARGEVGIADLSWSWARLAAAGKDAKHQEHDEDWIEKEAGKVAVALGKALGTRAGKNPEILARALEIYNAQLPRALAMQWADRLESEQEFEEE
jgi:hypothetical protein